MNTCFGEDTSEKRWSMVADPSWTMGGVTLDLYMSVHESNTACRPSATLLIESTTACGVSSMKVSVCGLRGVSPERTLVNLIRLSGSSPRGSYGCTVCTGRQRVRRLFMFCLFFFVFLQTHFRSRSQVGMDRKKQQTNPLIIPNRVMLSMQTSGCEIWSVLREGGEQGAVQTYVKTKNKVVDPTSSVAAVDTGMYLVGLNLFPALVGIL